jgi:hypothetical protein
MTVSEHQLWLDFEQLDRLRDRLRRPDRLSGAQRLLAVLISRGLAERDLETAAALCMVLDHQGEPDGR